MCIGTRGHAPTPPSIVHSIKVQALCTIRLFRLLDLLHQTCSLSSLQYPDKPKSDFL